jgi:hypothetical protein
MVLTKQQGIGDRPPVFIGHVGFVRGLYLTNGVVGLETTPLSPIPCCFVVVLTKQVSFLT